MADTFSQFERQLLTRMQWDFPLCPEPYAVLARELGATAEAVCGAVERLREGGVIRRIGGSFVPRRLGYVSVLVAARVAPERLAAVARHAAAFPEVTHNYEREGGYNLWFTVIAESASNLETILAEMRALDGVAALHPLPARQTFKIRVKFELSETGPDQPGDEDTGSPHGPRAASGRSGAERPAGESQAATPPSTDAAIPLDATDRRLIPRCCADLGKSDRPFAEMAAELGMSEEEIIRRLQGYKASGAMRRFGAVLRHQAAGFVANGMSGWNVPDADVERVAGIIAGCRDVSHCYERPRLPDWPYNVYGMIHGVSREDCLATAAELARATGIADYQVLFSLREFKKSSMVYLGG